MRLHSSDPRTAEASTRFWPGLEAGTGCRAARCGWAGDSNCKFAKMGNTPTAGEARSRSLPKLADRDRALGTGRMTSAAKHPLPSFDDAYVRKLKGSGKAQPRRLGSFDEAGRVASPHQLPDKLEAKLVEKSVEFCSKFFLFARSPINTNWGATFCDEATMREGLLHALDSKQANASELPISFNALQTHDARLISLPSIQQWKVRNTGYTRRQPSRPGLCRLERTQQRQRVRTAR